LTTVAALGGSDLAKANKPSPVPGSCIPVVLRGADLPWESVLPDDVVAFSYNEGWHQIPVQVDERDIVEFARIYGAYAEGNRFVCSCGEGIFEEVYCDVDTFTGADSDPLLDVNDEIAFMLEDGGSRALQGLLPDGVIDDSGLEVVVEEPIAGMPVYIYLFIRSGTLDPSAGRMYVAYDFRTLSGDYRRTYNTAGIDPESGLRNDDHGAQLNPENSTIRTDVYERHWSYRWTCDRLSLGGGLNLVEREDYWIQPGACGRHNGTFNAQEGAFIANISGPVRAIRSFVGANSGPLVQMDRIYYQAREDTAIHLRVHPRPAVGIFYIDHTMDALGMTYANNLNPTGVPMDGVPDRLTLGPIEWELVTGDQGSMLRLHTTDTDIVFPDGSTSLYYEDKLNTDTDLCESCLVGCPEPEPLGDQHLIGASGVWNTAPLPNTDPRLLAVNYLTARVTTLYGESMWSAEDAQLLRDYTLQPMRWRVVSWPAR